MTKKRKPISTMVSRPPTVAVLGHVDHGKTTLLDALRQTKVAAKEHGGITQNIGAYQLDYKGEKITFIDTPGHAAFVKMRSCGIAATDLVVLVIAADDGVQPQTKECLAHIKQTNTPFLVAINKTDLPQASPEMVKAQLAENGILVEGYGGDVVVVNISAKEKKGLDELLEMILLLGKMHNIQADPKGLLAGIVIDSKLDFQKGPLATVLVKNGTLSLGDQVFANNVEGKVKAMIDQQGKYHQKAFPGMPIVVLGFKSVPVIGALVTTTASSLLQKPLIKNRLTPRTEKGKVKLILKADTDGTLEAIKSSLGQEVDMIFSDVGQVSESDILLSQSTGAQIISFNVKIPALVAKLAEVEGITIKSYNIIYELLDDIEKKVLKILEPTIDEEVLGEAVIIAEFTIKGKHIAGCKIKSGKINKINKIHLKRDNQIIGDAQITSFQKERQETNEAKVGSEIGLVFRPNLDFKIGDAIISYSQKK